MLGRTSGGPGTESREKGREATFSQRACTNANLESGLVAICAAVETNESRGVAEVKAMVRPFDDSATISCPMDMAASPSGVPTTRCPTIEDGSTSTACAVSYLIACSLLASVSAPRHVVRNGPASNASGRRGTPAGVAPSMGESGLVAVPCPMGVVSGVVGLMGQVGQETKGLGMLGHTNVVMASEVTGRLEAVS